jgi:hypothetical protein
MESSFEVSEIEIKGAIEGLLTLSDTLVKYYVKPVKTIEESYELAGIHSHFIYHGNYFGEIKFRTIWKLKSGGFRITNEPVSTFYSKGVVHKIFWEYIQKHKLRVI